MQLLWTYRLGRYDQSVLWQFYQKSTDALGMLVFQFVITFLILTVFVWFNRMLRWPILFLCLAIWMPLDIWSRSGPELEHLVLATDFSTIPAGSS